MATLYPQVIPQEIVIPPNRQKEVAGRSSALLQVQSVEVKRSGPRASKHNVGVQISQTGQVRMGSKGPFEVRAHDDARQTHKKGVRRHADVEDSRDDATEKVLE